MRETPEETQGQGSRAEVREEQGEINTGDRKPRRWESRKSDWEDTEMVYGGKADWTRTKCSRTEGVSEHGSRVEQWLSRKTGEVAEKMEKINCSLIDINHCPSLRRYLSLSSLKNNDLLFLKQTEQILLCICCYNTKEFFPLPRRRSFSTFFGTTVPIMLQST